jgi:competence protein ComEC
MALGCVSFVAGIGLVAAGLRVAAVWFAVALAFLLLCRRRRLLVAVPAVIVAGLIAGMARGSQQAAQLDGYAQFYDQKVQVTGRVAEDPTYDDQQKVMYINEITVNGKALPGKVRVKTIAPVDPRRGDLVEVKGKLYDGFGSYQAAVYYAAVRVQEVANSPVDVLRREFAARIYSLLPDTQAGLGLGFLVGLKSSVAPQLEEQMKVLGLTHIVVASGYNLTVLVRLSRRLFAKSSHYQMTIASLGLICGFVLVTGFSPSMTRAALVTGLCVVAWYYGRRVHPALLISFAAAVTAALNPLFVWSDIGWWLSFLAFGGVMLLAPLLQRRIFGQKEPKLIGQVVIETICAQIATLPLIIFIFGDLAVLSVVANVVVVPLIPLAMILTFVAGVIGPLCAYAAWPAIWVLGYICQLVHLMAQVSWASVPFQIGLPIFVAAYSAIVAAGMLLWRKTKHDYLERSVIE